MTTRSATDVDAHIGRKVELARKACGMTQADLASRIGVSFQQLQKYETGINRISCSRLYAIAGAVGINPGHFFPEVRA